jgi:hypothetical protein
MRLRVGTGWCCIHGANFAGVLWGLGKRGCLCSLSVRAIGSIAVSNYESSESRIEQVHHRKQNEKI